MKTILFLLIAAVIGMAAHAQTASPFAVNSRAKGDTLTNADTLIKILPATAGYNSLTLQLNVKKLSGTVGGSIAVTASADNGVTYTSLGSASLTDASGTTPYMFTYSPIYYTHYKITVITSGTVSAKLLPWYYLRPFGVKQF